jgi:SHS2 domain-containing protein
MTYRYLDNIALADAAFEIEAKNLEELFAQGGEALFGLMVDLSSVQPKIKREFILEEERIDNLLFDFLERLIFLKDKEYLVFKDFIIIFNPTGQKKYKLKAVIKGEKIDPQRHKLKVDVKAVTLHLFKVEKKNDFWYARVVVDI